MYTEELVFEHGKLLPETNGLIKFARQCYKEAGSNLNFMLPNIDSMRENHMIISLQLTSCLRLLRKRKLISLLISERPSHPSFGFWMVMTFAENLLMRQIGVAMR